MYLRVLIKLLKCYIKEFFLKNRDIEWSRRGIGITLAVTLLGGTILGQLAVSWLVPDAYTYSFRVTRTEESIAYAKEAVDDGRIKEQSVGSNTREIPGKKGNRTIEEIITEYFPENPNIAIAIAKAESGLNPKATNHNRNNSDDYGVFQINSTHNPTYEEKTQPEANIRLARRIYDRNGWKAWSAFNNKSYLKFL